MDEAEFVAFVRELELAFRVDLWMVDGLRVWPLIRTRLGYGGLEEVDASARAHPASGGITRRLVALTQHSRHALAHLRALALDRRGDDSARGHRDALILSLTSYRQPARGGWYDRFAGPMTALLEQAGFSSRVLEVAADGDYRVPRVGRSRFLPPWLPVVAWSLAQRRARRARFEGVDEYRQLRELLCRRLPKADPPLPGQLVVAATFVRLMADRFKVLFAACTPRIAFIESYYSPLGMAFCLAARESGVRAVDVQHGAQGPHHAAYASWMRVPREGYSLFPELFWCWSEREAQVINAWAQPATPHRAVVGGNLLLHTVQRDAYPVPEPESHELAQLLSSTTPGAGRILVTLQWGRGLPDVIADAIARAPPSWQWWVRLHPVTSRAERAEVTGRLGILDPAAVRIQVEAPSRLPLYTLLRYVDVHVTEYSSCAVEADAFGIPSLICHPLGLKIHEDLLATGRAAPALSAAQLVAALERQTREGAGGGRVAMPRATPALGPSELTALIEGRL